MGPGVGIKGGATGGGYPRSCRWKRSTCTSPATSTRSAAAHNLLAALIDNHLHHGNRLGLDPERILWRRSLDLNDRALRRVRVALGGGSNGVEREKRLRHHGRSEVMAILSLSAVHAILKERLGRILVGWTAKDARSWPRRFLPRGRWRRS